MNYLKTLFSLKNSKKNTSGYRCVFKDKVRGKWRVQIKVNGEYLFTGRYDTKEEAAKAAKEAREKLHGQFARIQ